MAITYLKPSSRITYTNGPDVASVRDQIEPGIMGETSPTGQRLLENAQIAGAGYGTGQLAGLAGKLGMSGIGKVVGKIQSIQNAPAALEDALGTAVGKFGTSETPSMVGNAARTGLESEQSLNEALAKKLYGQVPEGVPVSTTRLASGYKDVADELPASLGNAIKKNIQLEPNPIRPNDIGTTNTKIYGMSMPDKTPVIPHQYTASPGIPSQLPPNTPSVQDLIKLRSKLGAAARMGGIDGYNAGQLKSALDQDIADLGSGEGPLGKMVNEATVPPLKQATSYYREMMNQQGTPLYRKLSTGKIEDIPNTIFNGGRTQDVLEARAALGEQGFQAAKRSFFNEVINSKNVGKVLEKYGKNNSDFLQTAFTPSELNSLRTIDSLQKSAVSYDRIKMLVKGMVAAAAGGGIAGKAFKFGMGERGTQ